MSIKHAIAIIVPSVLLGACAGSGANTARGLQAPEVLTDQIGLAPLDPSLPSADQQMAEIRDDAGNVVSAVVKLCVAPDGRVDSVNLLRRSSSRAYDRAVLSDVADWHFTGSMLTFSQADTCENATISYRTTL